MIKRFSKTFFVLGMLSLVFSTSVQAQVMSSGSYSLASDSMNFSGGNSSSGSYVMEDTRGESATGYSNSGSYIVHAGFQQGTGTSSATTTPTPTPTPTPNPGPNPSPGQAIHPYIYDIKGISGQTTLDITWSTNVATVARISWGLKPIEGQAAVYNEGSFDSSHLTTRHEAFIENLTPNTNYIFKIEVWTPLNGYAVVEGIVFKTLGGIDTDGPGNVSNFQATPFDESIRLTWKNPHDYDFAKVRIVKSESFFPANPFDGQVIYEGPAEKFRDDDVVPGKIYYYAAFAVDTNGNYSSGAITSAILGEVFENPLDNLTPAPVVHPQIADLQLSDFTFIQAGKIIVPSPDGTLLVDGMKNLKILLDYNKVPEILKTIAFTLTFPSQPDKQFSFLLRINKDKTAYEATLTPLGFAGLYGVNISIVDHKNRGLKNIQGDLIASVLGSLQRGGQDLVLQLSIGLSRLLILLAILIACLYVAWEVLKKKKENQKDLRAKS